MHASLRTSGKSGEGGLLHFNLKVTQRTFQLLRALFLARARQSWWISESSRAPSLLTNGNEGDCAVGFPVCADAQDSLPAKGDGRRYSRNFTAAPSADVIYDPGICFMTPTYAAWRWWLQVANCGGQTRTRDSWEQLPRETGGTWPSWGTRPPAWFTWRCMTERVRKVPSFLYLPLRNTRGRHGLEAAISS